MLIDQVEIREQFLKKLFLKTIFHNYYQNQLLNKTFTSKIIFTNLFFIFKK